MNTRIAIVSARKKEDALINNIAQLLSKKYDTHVYVAPGSPRLLWILHHIMLATWVSFRDYDLIIVQGFLSLGPAVSLWAKLLGKKSLIRIFGKYYDETRYWYTGMHGLLRRCLLLFAEYVVLHLADVICTSDPSVIEYIKRRRTKTSLCDNSFVMVDVEQFSYDDRMRAVYRSKMNIPESDTVLLFFGWLTENDGADTALNVYRALYPMIENLWLVYIGSGNLEESIKKTITAEKLEKVKLVGYIPHHEVQNYLMAGDIALIPYPPDFPQCGIGITTLELMALGIPIIATDAGMLGEVVFDGETGFVVENDVEAMAQKVALLVNNPELVKKMKRNARERVERDFSLEASSSKLFSLIDTCLNS